MSDAVPEPAAEPDDDRSVFAAATPPDRGLTSPRPGEGSGSVFGGTSAVVDIPPSSEGAPLVVVTGPSGPLGRAIRTALGRRGCLVAAVGGPTPSAPVPGSVPVLELAGDLAASEQVDRAAEFVLRLGEPVVGVIHIVVPSVGAAMPSLPSGGASRDDVLDRLDDDYLRGLRGPHQLTRRLLASLSVTRGRVVVVHPEILAAGPPALPESLRAELDAVGVPCASAVGPPH